MAVPPPPPGSQLLSGSTTVDLLGNSLTQWAYHVQDVTSGMRLPPEAAASCPQSDIVGVLNQLEGMTRVRYCRHCFGVGQKCRCSAVPHQAPGLTSALWVPPTVSYMAMVASTETMASTSAAGVTHRSYPPPGMPQIEAMDMLPAPTTENLLATAGVSRGRGTRTPPQTPPDPGICQMRPRMPQQQASTPEGRKQPKQHLIGSRSTHPNALPPSQAPPPVPARVTRSWPGKMMAPEVGPHPEGLRTGNEGTDPPPEDPG